jgi:hypothetical protein
MHPRIKQLYDQSYKNEDGAKVWHDLVFDIETFAQRLVFRCATEAKIAQAEGKDAYSAIMEKYGAEIQSGPTSVQIRREEIPLVSEEIPLVSEENELL